MHALANARAGAGLHAWTEGAELKQARVWVRIGLTWCRKWYCLLLLAPFLWLEPGEAHIATCLQPRMPDPRLMFPRLTSWHQCGQAADEAVTNESSAGGANPMCSLKWLHALQLRCSATMNRSCSFCSNQSPSVPGKART